MTETILLLPFFLLLAFGLIQLAQLGIALMVTNYAASAAARQTVQDGAFDSGRAERRFRNMLMAGMRNAQFGPASYDGGSLASNVTIRACADVPALPFVGAFLSGALAGGGCGGGKLVSMNGNVFVVQGRASARMNYRP
jgi:hypothetical protein